MQNVGRYADILFRAVCNYDKNMVYSQMGEEFAQYSKDVFMMHDIGRHYIPVSILNKASKLTEEEIQIIKNHTIDAAKAMESVYEEPYPKTVMEQLLQIALYHHERYDGITSWKPYKKRQTTKEEATEIILKEAGKQFDPVLVDIFLQCVKLF